MARTTPPSMDCCQAGLAPEECCLSPAAATSRASSRQRPEPESALYTAFQSDQNRIIRSESFRALMGKTQVFIRRNDLVRTRLTHTLEVAQTARTLGRILRLNGDLIEAVALAHDLGHPPFGHIGERALREVFSGFHHSHQSLRVIDIIEGQGYGLNLTDAVRDGVLRHSKERLSIMSAVNGHAATLEGEIVKIADGIAYINHDIDDAINMGVISSNSLPKAAIQILGATSEERINTMMEDVIHSSSTKTVPGWIRMSETVRHATDELRGFLFRHVYDPLAQDAEALRARRIVQTLFTHFRERPGYVLDQFSVPLDSHHVEQWVVDFVASLTDQRASELYEGLPSHSLGPTQ